MKANMKHVVLLLLMVAVFIFGAVIISDMVTEKETFTYGQLIKLFEEDNVKSFSINTDGYITIVTADEVPKKHVSLCVPDATGASGKICGRRAHIARRNQTAASEPGCSGLRFRAAGQSPVDTGISAVYHSGHSRRRVLHLYGKSDNGPRREDEFFCPGACQGRRFAEKPRQVFRCGGSR